MDTNRFDRVIRSLHDGAPRRQVLGVLLGGALGIAGLAGNEVAAKKKKITMCLNGQAISVKKTKKASLLGQGATVGACPKSPPSPPPPSCPTTQKLCDGRCIDKERCCTNSDCDPCKQQICASSACVCKAGTQPDANGICGTPPPPLGLNCTSVGGALVDSSAFCCSGVFVKPNPLVNQWLCLPGATTCKTASDCGGGACKGFMCPPLYAAIVGEGCS